MWLHSKYSSLFMTEGSIQVVAVVVGARLSATSTRPPVRQNLFADLPRQLQHCACAWLPLQAELFTGVVEGNLRRTYKLRENAWLHALLVRTTPQLSPNPTLSFLSRIWAKHSASWRDVSYCDMEHLPGVSSPAASEWSSRIDLPNILLHAIELLHVTLPRNRAFAWSLLLQPVQGQKKRENLPS